MMNDQSLFTGSRCRNDKAKKERNSDKDSDKMIIFLFHIDRVIIEMNGKS